MNYAMSQFCDSKRMLFALQSSVSESDCCNLEPNAYEFIQTVMNFTYSYGPNSADWSTMTPHGITSYFPLAQSIVNLAPVVTYVTTIPVMSTKTLATQGSSDILLIGPIEGKSTVTTVTAYRSAPVESKTTTSVITTGSLVIQGGSTSTSRYRQEACVYALLACIVAVVIQV